MKNHATKEQKMAMTRLAATLQNLHDGAHDQTIHEDQAILAAQQMGAAMLRHFDLIVLGLRIAGK